MVSCAEHQPRVEAAADQPLGAGRDRVDREQRRVQVVAAVERGDLQQPAQQLVPAVHLLTPASRAGVVAAQQGDQLGRGGDPAERGRDARPSGERGAGRVEAVGELVERFAQQGLVEEHRGSPHGIGA